MPLQPMSSESALAGSLRPCLHNTLQPLFNQSSPCLPALEKTCQKILSLAGGLTGADRLAQIISRDPALSCRVLQISNSIAYSPQQVITSIPHAVSWLSLDTVRSLVTASQLVEQLNQWPNHQRVVSGVIARALVAAVHANELGLVLEYPSLWSPPPPDCASPRADVGAPPFVVELFSIEGHQSQDALGLRSGDVQRPRHRLLFIRRCHNRPALAGHNGGR